MQRSAYISTCPWFSSSFLLKKETDKAISNNWVQRDDIKTRTKLFENWKNECLTAMNSANKCCNWMGKKLKKTENIAPFFLQIPGFFQIADLSQP